MQFPGKLKNQIWENGEKPNFGPNFGPFGPNFGQQSFFVDFTFTDSETLLQAILCNLKEY